MDHLKHQVSGIIGREIESRLETFLLFFLFFLQFHFFYFRMLPLPLVGPCELRLIEFNKMLQRRPLAPTNSEAWWEYFVNLFFDDDASITFKIFVGSPQIFSTSSIFGPFSIFFLLFFQEYIGG